MKTRILVVIVFLAVLLLAGGCGNVYLRGEALTAAEVSAMDAWQAATRAEAEPGAPPWLKAYTAENFRQWRCFVRSARKDLTWGPKLPDEGGE